MGELNRRKLCAEKLRVNNVLKAKRIWSIRCVKAVNMKCRGTLNEGGVRDVSRGFRILLFLSTTHTTEKCR